MFIEPTDKTKIQNRYVESYFPRLFNGIAFVAQSPGKNEVEKGIPLVGASGQLLEECCKIAGINFQQAFRGNVVGFRPPANQFTEFCAKKKDVGGASYPLPPIRSGQYLKPEFFPELERLRKELEELKPNLIVALGNEALWALTGLSGVGKYRGTTLECTLVPGLKVLSTYHPANIFRAYENRILLQLDLIKAKGESRFREIKQLERHITIYPEVPDLWSWEKRHSIGKDSLLSIDIEDKTIKGKKIIECIGFAFDKYNALVVPFWSDLRPGHSYWADIDDEIKAWEFIDYMLRTYNILGQNFVAYDTWVLVKEMGLVPRFIREDTMLAHHAFQPEMKKGLGLLASIYCNVPAWKTLRPRGKQMAKRDE